jgi:ubiquinone biosynthesis protein UbiJ
MLNPLTLKCEILIFIYPSVNLKGAVASKRNKLGALSTADIQLQCYMKTMNSLLTSLRSEMENKSYIIVLKSLF